MDELGIDAIIYSGSPSKSKNVFYFTGFGKITGGHLVKLRGQEPVLLHGHMEVDEAKKMGIKLMDYRELETLELRRHAPDEITGEVLFYQKLFKHMSISGTVLMGVEMSAGFAYEFMKRLDLACTDVEFVKDFSKSPVAEARITKEDAEIDIIKDLGTRVARVHEKVRGFLGSLREKDGLAVNSAGNPVTVGEVKEKISDWSREEKLHVTVDNIFAQGRDAGFPHSHGEDDDQLKVGKTIVFDYFPCQPGGGYFFDITRTYCLGEAPEKVRKLYDDVYEIQTKVCDSLELGKQCGDFDRMVLDFYEAKGYPTLRSDIKTNCGYVHSLGHGVGLDLHESPRLSDFSKKDEPLKPGYVFTVEPGLYFPDEEIGIRIEDVVAVRSDGTIENLTDVPKDLVIPLGG
jgi:Xaa-Pro aminopeptidase